MSQPNPAELFHKTLAYNSNNTLRTLSAPTNRQTSHKLHLTQRLLYDLLYDLVLF